MMITVPLSSVELVESLINGKSSPSLIMAFLVITSLKGISRVYVYVS